MSHALSRLLARSGRVTAFVVASLCIAAIVAQTLERDASARARMVERCAREGIKDKRVLQVMGRVPRHLFCPPDQRSRAYSDHALPIGHGQTISAPFIVAYMTEMLDPKPED